MPWICSFVFCLFAFTVVASGCKRENIVRVTRTEEDWIEVKHRCRTAKAAGWKAELWLSASFFRHFDPIDVSVRLTPDDEHLRTLLRVKVRVALAKEVGGKAIREARFEPTFVECAKMKKHKEQEMGVNHGGPIVEFPPPNRAWQTTIQNVLSNDSRVAGAKDLEQGNYVLNVEISLDKGPTFSFDDIPFLIGQSIP